MTASLWEIELDGAVTRSRHKVVASPGRLVGRGAGYEVAVREPAAVAAWRSRDRGP